MLCMYFTDHRLLCTHVVPVPGQTQFKRSAVEAFAHHGDRSGCLESSEGIRCSVLFRYKDLSRSDWQVHKTRTVRYRTQSRFPNDCRVPRLYSAATVQCASRVCAREQLRSASVPARLWADARRLRQQAASRRGGTVTDAHSAQVLPSGARRPTDSSDRQETDHERRRSQAAEMDGVMPADPGAGTP